MSRETWRETVRRRISELEPGDTITSREVSDSFGNTGPTPREISCFFLKCNLLMHVGGRASNEWERI